MDNKTEKTLADLVAGDEVALLSGYHSRKYTTRKIARVTATQLILEGDDYTRYRKDGYMVGNRSSARLVVPTDEVRESIRIAKMHDEVSAVVHRVGNVLLGTLRSEDIEHLHGALAPLIGWKPSA